MAEMDVDEKIYKTLAGEYGYAPASAKQLCSFVKYLHNFAQYLGAHKYYSDALNKRVAVLALDADMLALRSERVKLESEDIYSLMEIAHYSKKKVDLRKRVDAFKATLDAIQKDALEIHSKATKLMQDIKVEYSEQAQTPTSSRPDY